MKWNSNIIVALSLTAIFAWPSTAVFGQEAKKTAYRTVVSSNDVINRTHGGYKESQKLYVKIRQAFIDRDYDEAVKVGREIVDRFPTNLDGKVMYAEALYFKYKENPKDKTAKNNCIRMWLVIHRLISNDGWTLSDKSNHSPFAYRFFNKERRDLRSVERLKELCGRTPRWRESDQKFLKKVLEPETAVSGEIMNMNK